METIESRLVLGSVSFDELFSDQPDREEVVTLFIALLELLKLGKAHVRQNGTFDRIMLVRAVGRRKRMEPNEIPQILEAILFVAGEPVAVADLAQALEVSEMEIMHAVEELQRECERRGVTIHRYGDHLRMETRPEYAPYVERLLQPVQRQTLSQTAMETLAVIAYRQPVTKGEVEQVRGVKCDYSVQSLLHKGLIREAGRKEALGRPILYATTDRFLEHFGISDIRELPPLPSAQEKVDEPLTP